MKKRLKKIYSSLPAMTEGKCAGACDSEKCNFDCCTVSGCSGRERRAINWYIIRKHLKLPLMGRKQRMPDGSYFLPNDYDPLKYYGQDETIRCAYITGRGCAIYPVRPAICRLFGTCKEMVCSHFPEEAKRNFPVERLVDIGLLPKRKFSKDPDGAKKIFSKLMLKK
ncbi:MAG: hypothetical protein COY66_05810 [Candidatus Kerfeldbacteria bacterium CG_4_10_14_0_8_um_filter_42_10]|uniref:YkgJ family cysteine cluster protein n=1 Tax=Candidatus Kerfeldbacteria bacterium CG_4_10_14_0_8_um_filter_42_10 TaxID=2014248 RepID=A0A2M7RH54_9BACT|nr:MAG: hypothetical protein COY66_05810 [Candidatus Kerfeldbacteria bacterium CG_4_10_14_0_8_um_filter_42_10]